MVSLLSASVVGFVAGVVSVLLVARTRHLRQVRALIRADVDRNLTMMSRRIWAGEMPLFSDFIQSVSPMFCKIYAEAWAAEAGELRQICGIGYGKSLEFLMKDYSKHRNPSEHEAIEKSTLSACVRNFVPDPSIRNSAELATWLRNDEAHYVRRYRDKDLTDLKKLIALTVKLIEHAESKLRMDEQIEQYRGTLTIE
jgi:hypothetical protein